ncbi:hypothetical protein C8J56DRAFT_926248 [Mycena floridula]|nr:hypothetical protein C8J56DRAFT_926248 [Mycena floridula]
MNTSRRPATIAELAERARENDWDENGTVKHFLRLAERSRKLGADHANKNDLESAFVAFARAASLILEKIPNHRDYQTALTSSQRSNLAMNGQEILDNLGRLKPVLLERYEKWAKMYPNGEAVAKTQTPEEAGVRRLTADMERVNVNNRLQYTDHDRRAREELEKWKRQREENQRHQQGDDLHSEAQQRKEAVLKAARLAAQSSPAQQQPLHHQYDQPPAALRIGQDHDRARMENQRQHSQEAVRHNNGPPMSMPGPQSQGPIMQAPIAMHSRPPSFMSDDTLAMPLQSPKYDGESTDSEAVSNSQFEWRRNPKGHGDHLRTPTRSSLRSPSYPIPVTTTSPPPPDISRITYPQLMSKHQMHQGYVPSLNSMFVDPNHPRPAIGSSSLLFNPNRAAQPLYSSNLLPEPSVPPQARYPDPHQSQHAHYSTKPPPIAPESRPPDRTAQPVIARTESGTPELKTVNLPRACLPRFLAIAKVNTGLNRETCGLLLGKDKGNKFLVTTLLIPKQHSTSDTCTMDEEELVLQFTEERSLITLGWIHTHPTQSCFMSSVDLHTHSGFQRMLPESFAVVCAPKSTPNFGIFRLTDPPGLQTILACTEKAAFHPHPDTPIYTDADKGHVQMKDLTLEIVDLR